MKEAGRSDTTIRNAHATLRLALTLALVERRITVNWAKEVHGPAPERKPHPILTVADAGNVFVVASRSARASPTRIPAAPRRTRRRLPDLHARAGHLAPRGIGG